MTLSTYNAAQEHTLVLIKPDAFRRGLTGQIIERFERKGYTIVALSVLDASEEQLRKHYSDHVSKHFFAELVEYMRSSPIVAICLEGDQVVDGVRALAGSTVPTTAEAGTIRGDFGRDWGSPAIENVIHASDSPRAAEREMRIWFPGIFD